MTKERSWSWGAKDGLKKERIWGAGCWGAKDGLKKERVFGLGAGAPRTA